MGLLTIVVAFTGPGTPSGGWRVRFAADLQHMAAVVTGWLSWLPGWAVGLILAAGVFYLTWQARRHLTSTSLGGPPETRTTSGSIPAGNCRIQTGQSAPRTPVRRSHHR